MPGFEIIGEEEKKEVNKIFEDGGVLFAHGFDSIRNGKYRVRKFEKKFSEYLNVNFAQAVSSGTAALKCALKALDVKPGDEVITQSFTFIAVAEAIIDVGAKPVFINIDETLNMNPIELQSAITSKTKAIIMVHMLGVASRQNEILQIAKKNNIKVIDDSCESFGAKWNSEKLGIQADITCWSFDAGKTIITGEGGMVTTNDKNLFLKVREYHDHGHMYEKTLPRNLDNFRSIGFNYRMTEIQAAIGIAQLSKIDYILKQNRKNYSIYMEILSDIRGIKFREIPNKCEPLHDCLIFMFDSKKEAEECLTNFEKNQLPTKNVPDAIKWHFAIHWTHMLGYMELTKQDLLSKLKNSEDILSKSIAIPIFVKSREADVLHNARKIKEIILKILK